MKNSQTKTNHNISNESDFISTKIQKISKLVPNKIAEINTKRMKISDNNQMQEHNGNLSNVSKRVLKKQKPEKSNNYKLLYPEFPKVINSNQTQIKSNKLKMSIKKVESKLGIIPKTKKKFKKISIEFFEPNENVNDL